MKLKCLVMLMALWMAVPALAADKVGVDEGLQAERLTDEDVALLIEAAEGVRADLNELRDMRGQLDAKSAQDRVVIQERLQKKMARFLEIAGLTPEDFVRMVDADNGLDNGRADDEPPQFRVLEPKQER